MSQAKLVVGIGENAVDVVMRVRVFPAPGVKDRVEALARFAGGSVSTALIVCRRLGLRARYLGSVGDDDNGRFQLASLRRERVDVRRVRRVKGARSRVSHIIVDAATGERVVLWERDRRLALRPRDVPPQALAGAAVLHLDATDVSASVQAARLARRAGLPVVADLDTACPGLHRLLPLIDYLIAPAGFVASAAGERDPFRGLERLAGETRARMVAATLGRDGALALSAGGFIYSPGFEVRAMDTTGAGDVFHGAFVYALVRGWRLADALEFSNALAGLSTLKPGARGGIASEQAARRLMLRGARNVNRDLAARAAEWPAG